MTSTTTTTSTTTSFINTNLTLQVKKLSESAILPIRGSEWAAGYDLSAAQAMTIPAGKRGIVPTDLSIACPAGTYGRIAPRSGLTVKMGIHVGAGVVDADYRGPVGVVLFNLGDDDFHITPGDRIAQLILEQIVMAPVEEVNELDDTVRGSSGFGSTGVEGLPCSSSSSGGGNDINKKRKTSTTTSISPSNSSSEAADNDITMDDSAHNETIKQ
jgi:dUTP pyrophosphatase